MTKITVSKEMVERCPELEPKLGTTIDSFEYQQAIKNPGAVQAKKKVVTARKPRATAKTQAKTEEKKESTEQK